MTIDAASLNEVLPLGTHCKFKDERWFQVPGHDDIAFSTYCQLAQRQADGRWERIRKRYLINPKRNRSEAYPEKRREGFHLDGQKYFIEDLIRCVFFSNLDVWRIVPQSTLIHRGKPNSANELLKRVEDVHILFTPNEYAEYVAAKCEGREPNYPAAQQHHTLINLKRAPQQIEWQRNNIRQRARKRGIPFCREWDNPDAFRKWYYEHEYRYTGRYMVNERGFDVDSDLMNMGECKAYSTTASCLLPNGINIKITNQSRIKTSTRCAKVIARLNEILVYERPRGEIPAYILQKLEQLRGVYEIRQRELEAKEQAERECKEAERQRAKEQQALERQRKRTMQKGQLKGDANIGHE